MSTVTKSVVEAYRIQSNGEWATIAVQGWRQSTIGGAPAMEHGELLVHSSFGSWGYQWNNLGLPIKQFLLHTSFDYLMGKLMPGRLREFDYDASLASWQSHLRAARRARTLTADEFNEAWSDSRARGSQCGIELFLDRITCSQPLSAHEHPLWSDVARYSVCRVNSQAAGFWRELWPLFVQRLRGEMESANDERPAAVA